MTAFIDKIAASELAGKRVLVRVDFNVPMHDGKIIDDSRIRASLPTIQALIEAGAKVIIVSHFGRPKGKVVPTMSLEQIFPALKAVLANVTCYFCPETIGKLANEAVSKLQNGELLLLENVRFNAGEEKDDPEFAKSLSELGDFYINDTFSCSHRAHASITGITKYLPSAAGKLLNLEISSLEKLLANPQKPMMAIVGGSKVSTKLELLYNLVTMAQYLVIGGAMANTFLKALNLPIGKSFYEEELVPECNQIIEKAKAHSCQIVLPSDVVCAEELVNDAAAIVCPTMQVPDSLAIFDLGPNSVEAICSLIDESKTVVWNGPVGAFEYQPFDAASKAIAQHLAERTHAHDLVSVAGGGDVVACVTSSGYDKDFTYISTAGGAFLEWLEGKKLPGVAVLDKYLG